MAKEDPRGRVANPIDVKLAHRLGGEAVPSSSHVETKRTMSAPTRERKAFFTTEELRANDRLVRQIGESIGVDSLSWSAINRSIWRLLRENAAKVDGSFWREAPQLTRPSNGNLEAMAEFEESLAKHLRRMLT